MLIDDLPKRFAGEARKCSQPAISASVRGRIRSASGWLLEVTISLITVIEQCDFLRHLSLP